MNVFHKGDSIRPHSIPQMSGASVLAVIATIEEDVRALEARVVHTRERDIDAAGMDMVAEYRSNARNTRETQAELNRASIIREFRNLALAAVHGQLYPSA